MMWNPWTLDGEFVRVGPMREIPAPSVPVGPGLLLAVVGAAAGRQLFAGVPWDLLAVTGALKRGIDAVRNRFQAGGIVNLLEVIERITHLPLMRRLGGAQTAREH